MPWVWDRIQTEGAGHLQAGELQVPEMWQGSKNKDETRREGGGARVTSPEDQ
jgi:hypothetical protein